MLIKHEDREILLDEELSYAHAVSTDRQLIWKTVGNLINEAALKWPTTTAFIFPTESDLRMTYAELRDRVKLMAQNLLQMGFKPGDRIGIALRCRHEIIVLLLASAYIGVVTVLLNQSFKKIEFEHLLNRNGCKGLLIFDSLGTTNYIEILKSISPDLDDAENKRISNRGNLQLKNLPSLRHIIVINNQGEKLPDSCWSYEDFESKRLSTDDIQWPYVDPEDISIISFTSGTTGTPKGATHRHFSFINLAASLKQEIPDGMAEHYKFLFLFPTLHISLPIFLNMALMNGTPMIFPFKDFKASEAVEAIQAYKPYSLAGSPRMLHEIINEAAASAADLTSINLTLIGGNIVTYDLYKRCLDSLGKNLNFSIIYGSSETLLISNMTIIRESAIENNLSANIPLPLGYLFANVEIKIVDHSTKQVVPLGHDGLLHVRTPFRMVGYFDEPQKTKETIDSNNWIDTGDLVSLGRDGVIYFKSRLKESIKIYDSSVYPFEVETYINRHPNVRESCVFGVRVNDYEEAVCAWIALKEKNVQTTSSEIKQFFSQNFADSKQPRHVKFVENFEKNALGKFERHKMSQLYKEELGL